MKNDVTLSYKSSGVDIDTANDTKSQMGGLLETSNARVLNKVGAFSALYDGAFPNYKHPVLVLKTEEPGSKQKIALENNSVETVCYDLINHLVNDAIVMGAQPLSVQDCIVCGKLEKDIILRIVSSIAKACQENECVLTGGETSEQPGVIEAGTYILSASIVGVVEKDKVIDGSKIRAGDAVIALASSGLHTNGYSLVRKLMTQVPEILNESVDGQSFMKTILTPHRPYYACLKGLFGDTRLVGLAHITGGGIKENLNRILPKNLNAEVDLEKIKILPIFKTLRQYGNLEDTDMLRTFNMGVGITAVVQESLVDEAIAHFKEFNVDAYRVGSISSGEKQVTFKGQLNWN